MYELGMMPNVCFFFCICSNKMRLWRGRQAGAYSIRRSPHNCYGSRNCRQQASLYRALTWRTDGSARPAEEVVRVDGSVEVPEIGDRDGKRGGGGGGLPAGNRLRLRA